MKIDSTVRARFRRSTLRRFSGNLRSIGSSLGVAEYKAPKDFKTEVLRSLGVRGYDRGTSSQLAFGEGGDLTIHPFYVVGLVLEFHNRSHSRFRKLSLNVSLSRFGSTYKVRGTVGWNWPLRVKYQTGYRIRFPFSTSDAELFDEHLSNMETHIHLDCTKKSEARP